MYTIVPLYLLLFLICYPRSCHLYTLLHFLIFVTLYVVTHESCHLYTLLYFLIFVTLHVVTHYSYTCILCIAYILLYVYVADFITVYAHHNSMQTALPYMHNTIVWLCCMLHICMFMSITSPLYNIFYYINLKTTVDMTR